MGSRAKAPYFTDISGYARGKFADLYLVDGDLTQVLEFRSGEPPGQITFPDVLDQSPACPLFGHLLYASSG